MLACLFDADSSFGLRCTDEAGRTFVDRNGDLFARVLEFLRTGRFIVPSEIRGEKRVMDREIMVRLLEEAQYFGLQNMVSAIRTIISCDEVNSIHEYLTLGYRTVPDLGNIGLSPVQILQYANMAKNKTLRDELFEHLDPVVISAEAHAGRIVVCRGGPKFPNASGISVDAIGEILIKACSYPPNPKFEKGGKVHPIARFEEVRLLRFP